MIFNNPAVADNEADADSDADVDADADEGTDADADADILILLMLSWYWCWYNTLLCYISLPSGLWNVAHGGKQTVVSKLFVPVILFNELIQ